MTPSQATKTLTPTAPLQPLTREQLRTVAGGAKSTPKRPPAIRKG